MLKESAGRRIFLVVNNVLLSIAAIICILPLVHIAALSFSTRAAASAGLVTMWPVDFNIVSYRYVFDRRDFWDSIIVTFQRIIIGGSLNMFIIVMVAYPLSKESSRFKARTFYVWMLFITTLFSGGLIPEYMMVRELKLLDTIWALTLPVSVPVFHIILMLNFYRRIPRELEEASLVDGAGHFTTLIKVYLPISLPSIATLTLFTLVFHWNSWFDGIIYMNRPENYPLQSYLQTVIVSSTFTIGQGMSKAQWTKILTMSDRTIKAAQIFIAAIPILIVYPFLQRYFITGIVLGSVKG